MYWKDLSEENRMEAAELIGMIDSGERWIFEHSDKDSDFHGFICNKEIGSGDTFGVISAAYYKDSIHISTAFRYDLPAKADAEESTAKLLTAIIKSAELNTYIWCKTKT